MKETYRHLSIVMEIDRSIKYLRNGLAEIQKISSANDFYDPLLLFLSGGLERLFKSMLCLNFKELNGRLPNPNEMWNNKQGHNIEFLKRKIENICIPVTRPFAKMDYEIITKDQLINSICKVLSEFGIKSKYFNLDAILGTDQNFNSKKAWEKIESSVNMEYYGQDKYYELLQNPGCTDELYFNSNTQLVIRLELFFRALTRQFIFGNFSSNSKTFLFEIEDFSDIEDNKIGTIDYRFFENHKKIKGTRKSKVF